jgi:YggT family protein
VGILCLLSQLYLYIVLVRVVLSWFPIRPGTAMASVYSALLSVTEPVLAPLRNVIPPVGMIDISPMVLFFGLILLQRVVC